MNPADNNKLNVFSNTTSVSEAPYLQSLLHELGKFPQDIGEIKRQCKMVKNYLPGIKSKLEIESIRRLLSFIPKTKPEINDELFLLFETTTIHFNEPWLFIKELLSLSNEEISLRALDLLKKLASDNVINIDSKILDYFADKQEVENSFWGSQEVLRKIFELFVIISRSTSESPEELLFNYYFEQKKRKLRVLAAKLLDLRGSPPSEFTIEKLLGVDAAKKLSDYLSYTRATHFDLLYLTNTLDSSSTFINSLHECEKICHTNLIKEIIAKLGWKYVNYGIYLKHFIGISINNSPPFYVLRNEAELFNKFSDTKKITQYFLFTTRGGMPIEKVESEEDTKPVALFRSYNLAHANVLQEILDISPLTTSKVINIIKQMDKIVSDFVTLFISLSDECKVITEVYEELKSKIFAELNKQVNETHLSAEATRLVQMFEDPKNIGTVNTLHGLKRYLHQKGLQLGFKLVDQSKSPNQNISFALCSVNRVLSVVKKINFVDFEDDEADAFSLDKIKYSIKVVMDAFARHVLYNPDSFPSVNIFCYGNEIHYFVWFRNHPMFIRIDYSPPLQGGMIDLQYFGVSNYEIADHPNIYLDAIKIFFNLLEFDINMDGTHIHARYDKERALDLRHLCERAEYLFCLVPYMMDLDWVIGSLNLSLDAKKKVAHAWSEFFLQWGVLPVKNFLTKDRLGILQDLVVTPEGEHEIAWSGDDEYQDRFTNGINPSYFESIFNSIKNLGLKIQEITSESFHKFGQFTLEKEFLNPLRESLSNGEITLSERELKKESKKLFQRIHEAELFAEIVSSKGKELELSTASAKVISFLERTIRFRTTGTLESFKVQSSSLPLQGESLSVFVLRDFREIIRSAFFIYGNILHKKRNSETDDWKTNANFSPSDLLSLLRKNNYNVIGSDLSIDSTHEETRFIYDELSVSRKLLVEKSLPGENIINGLRAAPGKASGRVLLGINRRIPEDFNERIFVAPSVSPDECTFIFHSAGIIATGGGILSHAGLIATQFNKPALIISGKWVQQSDDSQILLYNTMEFQSEHKKINELNVTLFFDFQLLEHQMRDGDLVLLDANEGTLQNFGQEINTIALYENLKALGQTNETLNNITDEKTLLTLRGKKLHIKHNIEKLLERLNDLSLAKYTIQEIMIGNFLSGSKSTPAEKIYLLSLILKNDLIGKFAEEYLCQIAYKIDNDFSRFFAQAEKNIPKANYPFEIVIPRLKVFQTMELLENVITALSPELLKRIKIKKRNADKINKISIDRLEQLRKSLFKVIHDFKIGIEKKELIRHLLRQLKRIDQLLKISSEEKIKDLELQLHLDINDDTVRKKYSDKFILKPGDGSLELAPLIGWKAANLAELEQLGGIGSIPDWFVVTDKAFQYVLDTHIKNIFHPGDEKNSSNITLREAIEKILSNLEISNREKSLQIRNLWNTLSLPENLKQIIIDSYHEIERSLFDKSSEMGVAPSLFVAIRSSSCEEDAEIAARAGEFETYLFIIGEDRLIDYLKRTWSGLWTERAIHNRAAMGNSKLETHGGVIVQRIIWSRVSGVLQTINVAKNELNEMVINAGLGLGEGVVSGSVAADQIIVSKEGDLQRGPLHFNYITADKNEQVLFNKNAGFGTVLTSTLYHQRFRAALEYAELCELVAVASQLESAYGYPLDIEFAIEGTKLWILQVRPVATFLPAFNETIKKYPIVNRINKTSEEKIK